MGHQVTRPDWSAVSGWTGEELRRIGGAEELRLASRRQDGSLRPFTTMWVVQAEAHLAATYTATGRRFLGP
jgi:Uncharacterized protein conserved in bacteria (DUF2255)